MGRWLPFTSRLGLWRLSPLLAFSLAAISGTSWLALLRLGSAEFEVSQYQGSLIFGIVAAVLTWLFLARLPTGRWYRRLLYEFLIAVGSVILSLSIYQLAYWITPPLERYNFLGDETLYARIPSAASQPLLPGNFTDTPLAIIWILQIFSFITVRLAGRFYHVLLHYRRRYLIWYITSSQLVLVFLTAFLVFWLVVSAFSFNLAPLTTEPLSTTGQIIILLTGAIIILGLMGILTGLAVMVIIIPVTALSYFTARGITRRLHTLIHVTSAMREGNYAARVEVVGEDEVARLQADFNMMAATLEKTLHDLAAERDAVSKLLQSRRELFAGVSHELRTPVTTVRSYLESLHRQAAQNPALKADVEIIERETLHLQRMIDDVFLLARTDVDHLNVQVAPLEISRVLEQTVTAAKQQAWQSKKVEVVLNYQPQLPLIYADETRLEQILNNLLKNAVRHTLPGGVIVVGAQPEAHMVCIQVKDTGEGIALADLPHIWERFYRSAAARVLDQGGAGLGLALVKELTEAMHGQVNVESVEGQGSNFTVRLPRVNPQSTKPT